MNPSLRFVAGGSGRLQVLWEDGERLFCRGDSLDDGTSPVLAVLPCVEHPAPAVLERLAHEYELRDELDAAWAAKPLEFVRDQKQAVLLLQDPGGEPLARLIGRPMVLEAFLRLAVALSVALGRLHGRSLVHKDIKPANVLLNASADQVWLTGFGIASRLPRHRQAPTPPEFLEGTLAYMAPEQTGRTNRSIDSRSDLYAFGVTLYQMLTGCLPFTAADPMEWVHCHIARKPLPPSERSKNIPVAVSEIIMKLLAKTGEERYQTAAGVESDLRRCLAEQERKGRIAPFALGEHDVPDRLLLPEKLYGRAREIETLLASFDRIVNGGAAELVLVSGYSGIGKSSLVNELHKVLVPPRGLFASGKFDQYKRDIPYSTIAQAFQSLVRLLLGKSDAELTIWREAFREALGPNGRLIVDLVPELKLIIGEQPPVLELPPQDAQRRFQLVFRRFLTVFARPEHPLALFLDDLQWLDSATLDLLEDLLTQPDVRHLMLIGAYRDNEVDPAHPLIRKLEAIRKAGAVVHEMALAPLARGALGLLIKDALRCESERATALADLIHEKTAGNPFFANQLIAVLVEEGLLTFDYDEGQWSWDLDRIRAKGFTDNVVDLMVVQLHRLPAETQQALQLLACMGNSADFTLLELASRQAIEEMHGQLWEAVRAGLISRSGHAYSFLHDRVQEAAYSLIPQEARTEAHLQIGRVLAARIEPEKQEESIFEIVNQLNRGAGLIASQAEREQVAELNWIAGTRAKASSAYASALNYFAIGATLLEADCWERCYDLTFALEIGRSQCEFLTGELIDAERRLIALSGRARDAMHQAAVASLRVDLHLLTGQNSRAVEVGLAYLRDVGIDWSLHPTDDDTRAEYQRMRSQLGDRTIEDLIDLPLLTDSTCIATLEVLTRMFLPAARLDANLRSLVACRAVSLSLEHGNGDASCVHYAWLGRFLASSFGDYQAAYRFGRLACNLVDLRGLTRFQAQVYFVVASNAMPWGQHVKDSRELIARALDAASRTGNLIYEAYSLIGLGSNMLIAGDSLKETQRTIEVSLPRIRQMKFRFAADLIAMQLDYVRTLRGCTRAFASFDDLPPEDGAAAFDGNPELAALETLYWIRVLQARFLAGDYAAASNARSMAESRMWAHPTEVVAADFHFFGALCLAACFATTAADQSGHLETLHAHNSQLQTWQQHCPANFEHRSALVAAEIARIEGRDTEAMRLYERAIRAAEANGFLHHKAIACELAGYFYDARGFERIARIYLRDARHCYLHWGADAKVGQLERKYPDLAGLESPVGPTSTIGTPVEQLDLATVIKISQAVSGEIAIEPLIDTLMHIAMEQAGAERALLVMSRGKESRIEAEATTSDGAVNVRLVDEPVTENVMPESVLRYVLRAREIAILDDAAAQSPYGEDSYIRRRRVQSILCLPLLNQAKLIGVLYLENKLTPRAFAPARLSVLRLLASQAAIGLENARLYREVVEREKQQTATAEMLRVIASSPIQSVLDAVAENAARLSDANNAEIFRLENNLLRLAASYGEIPLVISAHQGILVDRDTVAGRAACDRRTIQVRDLVGEEREYPVGSSNAKLGGHRTTLATPLLREGIPIGVILVRRREVRPFSDEQIALIETFADQAVIAIENARLFEAEKQHTLALARANRDLADREAKIRRIVDSGIIGIYVWDFEGHVLDANDEFLRMVKYDRDDLVAGRITWTELTPPDWRDRTNEKMARQKSSGRFEPFEKEYTRKDGSRFPLLVGGATFEEGGDQGIAFVVDLTDQKRAEEKSRESELKLRKIIETVPSMLWSAAPDGEPTRVNQRVLDYGGLRFEDFVSLGWKEFLHPEDFAETERAFYRAIQTGEPYEAVHRLRRADGQYRWHHARGEPLRDEEQRVIQWYGLSIDIDERKRAEDGLRRSEAYLAEAERLSHTGGWAVNRKGERTIVYWSAESYRIFGFDPLQGIPTRDRVWQRIHPEDRSCLREEADAALREKRDYMAAFRILLPDGTVKYVESNAHHMFSAGGELLEVMGTFVDVTERKRAEQALRESETKFRDYAETASDWFWETGPDYKFTLLTGNAFDSDPAQRIGTTCWEHVLDFETEPDKWRLMRAALDARESFRDFVYCTIDGNGAPMHVKASGKPVFDSAGKFLGYRGTGTDVTAIVRGQRAEASLQTVQAELAHVSRVMTLGQLTASIAHEVNQPIGSARNNARAALNFLDRIPPDMSEVREALGCIVADADRAGGIIDRIRDQIRKVPPRSDRFDLNRAIKEVIELAQSMITENGVSVHSRLSSGTAPVRGDRVQLQQVILNLILNAIEAMSSVDAGERELLISAEQSEANDTLVAVRDSGPGIDPRHIELVFEAFYSTKSGMGMGLSICRSIIAAHGGRLWAATAEPRGALFQFTLPNDAKSLIVLPESRKKTLL